jgi:hypothetical protein|tara:strand:- start:6489 stop:6773 length:285 start_codon:yes stop_codon:yes gene_type:complete
VSGRASIRFGATRVDLFANCGELTECAIAALGADHSGSGEPTNPAPEDFQTIVEACGIDQLFQGFEGGAFFGGDGAGGDFGGGFFRRDGGLAPE